MKQNVVVAFVVALGVLALGVGSTLVSAQSPSPSVSPSPSPTVMPSAAPSTGFGTTAV